MLVDSSELLVRFQPIIILILILLLMFALIWIYTRMFENKIQRTSLSNDRRRNDEEIGGVNSTDVVLPKYVESATQDAAYAPPPYATERDFCHAVNIVQSEGVLCGQNGENSRNFESSAHNSGDSNQVNSEARQVVIPLRNIAN